MASRAPATACVDEPEEEDGDDDGADADDTSTTSAATAESIGASDADEPASDMEVSSPDTRPSVAVSSSSSSSSSSDADGASPYTNTSMQTDHKAPSHASKPVLPLVGPKAARATFIASLRPRTVVELKYPVNDRFARGTGQIVSFDIKAGFPITDKTIVTITWSYTYIDLMDYLKRHKRLETFDIPPFSGLAKTNHAHQCPVEYIVDRSWHVPPLLSIQLPMRQDGVMTISWLEPGFWGALGSPLERLYLAFLCVNIKHSCKLPMTWIDYACATGDTDIVLDPDDWLYAQAFEMRGRLNDAAERIYRKYGTTLTKYPPLNWARLKTANGRFAIRVSKQVSATRGICPCCGQLETAMTDLLWYPSSAMDGQIDSDSKPSAADITEAIDSRCALALERIARIDRLVVDHMVRLIDMRHQFINKAHPKLSHVLNAFPRMAADFFVACRD